MKKKVVIFVMLLCISMLLSACKKDNTSNNASSDAATGTMSPEQASEIEHISDTGELTGDTLDVTPTMTQGPTPTQRPDIIYDGTSVESSIPEDTADFLTILKLLPAGTIVNTAEASNEEIAACFYEEEIKDDVFARISGLSYGIDCTVSLADLRYVRVLHYGFDGSVYIGELVVNKAISSDIVEIFKELYDAAYPVEQMKLVDDYGADDEKSMEADNTSAFNFRTIEGSTTLSNHAYGLAIDINPKYNPYVKENNGSTVVYPENAEAYADRSADCDYYIEKDDVCYQAFISRGFTWGGDWTTVKDYQHFEKSDK